MKGRDYYQRTQCRMTVDENGEPNFVYTHAIFDTLGRRTKYKEEDFEGENYVKLIGNGHEYIWVRDPDLLHVELRIGMLPEFDHLKIWYSENSYKTEEQAAKKRATLEWPFNNGDIMCDFTVYYEIHKNLIALKEAGNKYAEELEIIYLVNRLTEEKI